MPGRKAKPASLKKATGNPGHRPIAEYDVPEAPPATMPEYLSRNPAAVALWNEYAPALTTLGTLNQRSERMFAMWCAEMAMYERAPRKFTASRITQVRSLAASLGMDPSAMGKFATPKNGDNQDPAESFFTGPKAVND